MASCAMPLQESMPIVTVNGVLCNASAGKYSHSHSQWRPVQCLCRKVRPWSQSMASCLILLAVIMKVQLERWSKNVHGSKKNMIFQGKGIEIYETLLTLCAKRNSTKIHLEIKYTWI